MGRNVVNSLMAAVILAVCAVEVRAEEGIVLPRAPGVVAMSNDNERRAPQAPPPDPSKDPNARPDARHIKRAVGGLVGGLVGLAAASFIVRGTTHEVIDPRVAGVSIGIVVGSLIGGR